MNEHERPAAGVGTKTRSQVATIGDVEDAIREIGATKESPNERRDQAILELARVYNDLNDRLHDEHDRISELHDRLADRVAALERARADEDAALADTVPAEPEPEPEPEPASRKKK